jgi:Tfp pilus assembly protein PilV
MIEALIALLVVAVGALAIGRLSSMLARHAEVARHRTEAVSLAQAKLDELRSLAQLDGTGGSQAASAPDHDEPAATSNTRFERRWQVTGARTDAYRRIDVQVDWTDRDGLADPAGVRLAALVARADATDSARLALPDGEAPTALQPLGRSVAIPWQAVRMSGANRGRSVLRWGAQGSSYLVFDDASGRVMAQCDSAPTERTDLAAACLPIDALLLSGYLSGPGAGGVTEVAIEQSQYLVAAPVCRIDNAVAADGQPIAGVRAYRCLLRPGDHDGNAGTARVWSGRAVVLPQPVGAQSVCRYTTPAGPGGGVTRNEDHPAAYALVSTSLVHQNFAVIAGGLCPDGSVQHQPE